MSILINFLKSKKLKIKFWPSWLLKKVPEESNKIKIKIKYKNLAPGENLEIK